MLSNKTAKKYHLQWLLGSKQTYTLETGLRSTNACQGNSNCHTLAGLTLSLESQTLRGELFLLSNQIKYVYQLVVDTPLTGSLILLQKIARTKRAVIGGAR